MRCAALLIALAACGPKAPPPIQGDSGVPRLLAPPLIDADVRGAQYLTAIALQLQPSWHQFLEDCRLRLPAAHRLNRMALMTTAELVLGKGGELVELRIVKSGTVEFDQAVEQVVRDAAPLPAPPRELWSDDDRVHLAWTFARDRRQAGPATAHVIEVELPLRGVVDRRIGEHDLTRAAQRILRGKPSADRELATQHLMIATVREALESSDTVSRRAALDAISRARASELAMEVRQVLAAASDIELRIAATHASAALRDADAAPLLLDHLRINLRDQPRAALAGIRALVALGRENDVRSILANQFNTSVPNPIALQAMALTPIQELAPRLASWFRSGGARTRAAVCSALPGYPSKVTASIAEKGVRDRDATVRATCIQTAPAGTKLGPELLRDRDSSVRAAYASVLGSGSSSVDELKTLIEDRDPDVRAAAWTSLAAVTSPPAGRASLASKAAADPSAQVRVAAVAAIDDDDVLARLAKSDDASDVRTAALVQLTLRRGRAASTDLLLERLADAPAGSGERVRTALAWLLAH